MSEFDYKKTNVIKIIIQNPDANVLLIQEPKSHEWMPGHWGLPGGKIKLKESLFDAIKRITKEEIGVEVDPLGIFRIEEVLDENETVLIFNAVSLLRHPEEIKTKITIKWVGVEGVKKMQTIEFTEFFNKKLLIDYLTSERGLVDFSLIETQQFFDLHEDPEYKKWLESGKRK